MTGSSNLSGAQFGGDHMAHAQRWASEYPMSPVAHPEVTSLIRQFPPSHAGHEMYSKLMNNAANYHAQEWFKAGDADEFHEPTFHLTNNYKEAHNGHSEIEGLL